MIDACIQVHKSMGDSSTFVDGGGSLCIGDPPIFGGQPVVGFEDPWGHCFFLFWINFSCQQPTDVLPELETRDFQYTQ